MCVLSNRMSRVVSGVFWTVLAVAATGGAGRVFAQEAGAADSIKTKTFWEMLQAGGPILLLLALLSVVTATLIIERFLYYRSVEGSAGELLHKIKQGADIVGHASGDQRRTRASPGA